MTTWEEDVKNYNAMLYDICEGLIQNKDIAEKYNKTAGYISQIKSKVQKLKFAPKMKDGELICTKCESKTNGYSKWNIHHVHNTGELIAILCHACNKKMGEEKNRFESEESESIEKSNTESELMLDEELLEEPNVFKQKMELTTVNPNRNLVSSQFALKFNIRSLDIEIIKEVARVAVSSKIFGENEGLVAMKILKGCELGIGPFHALDSINVIKGKASISSELMKALVLSQYPNAIIKESILYADDKKVSGYMIIAQRGEWKQQFKYTLTDANKAGLLQKDNWIKHTEDMLRNRATSKMARTMFPDVITGASYTPEELEDDTEEEKKRKKILKSIEEKNKKKMLKSIEEPLE